MDTIANYLLAHPKLMPFVLWPLVTALLSFANDWIKTHSPTTASLLRKSGFNLYGLLILFWPKRLPPPPPPPSKDDGEDGDDGGSGVTVARAARVGLPFGFLGFLSLLLVLGLCGCPGSSGGDIAKGVLDISDAVCTELDQQPDYVDFICTAVHIGDGVSKTFKARVRKEDAVLFAARHCGGGEVAP